MARFGLTWGAIAALSFVIAAWTGSRSLLATDGAYFSPLYPSVGLLGGLAAMTVAGFGVERRRADRAELETAKSHRLMVQTLLSLTGIRDAGDGSSFQAHAEIHARDRGGIVASIPISAIT